MKENDLDTLKLWGRALNLALPMLWLVAMAVWGFIGRAL